MKEGAVQRLAVTHTHDAPLPTFAALLKRCRIAHGWTQEELADHAGVSVASISQLERGTRRRPRRDTLDLLASALNLVPPERIEFISLGRGTLPSSHPSAPEQLVLVPKAIPRSNLPVPPTPLLGRTKELGLVLAQMARPEVRLLTLVGVGGCGKTHLGIEVAGTVAERYPDGVCYVSLAPVRDHNLFPAAVAHALGLSERGNESLSETLAAYLSTRHLLLVLDNFEHLPAAALQVASWLQSCPDLHVLVTSRRALHLRGEYEFPVPPLELPNLDALPSLADLARVPAVELFLERGRAAVPSFTLTRRNAATIAAICHQLDGLPLALELAAPHLKMLSLEMLRERLTHRLNVLTDGAIDLPERQQSLRATLAWSYHLLSHQERWLFRRLGVFAGGASLKAIESLCGADDVPTEQIIRMLSGVQSINLIQEHESADGELRFTLLETIREFAWSCLTAEAGEEETAQHQHATYFLALAEDYEYLARQGKQTSVVIATLDEEYHNFRVALRWLLSRRVVSSALRLSTALRPFWYMRGYLSEGRQWLEQALQLAAEQESAVPDEHYAKALNSAGVLAFAQGDFEHALVRYQESLAIGQQLRDQVGMGKTLLNLGIVAQEQGDLGRARDFYEQGLALIQEMGDRRAEAQALNGLGIVARQQGDLAHARRHHEMSLSIRREYTDERGIAISLNNLGNVAVDEGEWDRAQTLFGEALAIRRRLQDSRGTADTLTNLAYVAQMHENAPQARLLAEEAVHICRQIEDDAGLAVSLLVSATLACLQEDVASGAEFSRQSLSLHWKMNARVRIADCLERLAYVAWKIGYPDVAARRLGSAAALRESLGVPVEARERSLREDTSWKVCQQLGTDHFMAACQVGRQLPLEEAIAEALTEEAE